MAIEEGFPSFQKKLTTAVALKLALHVQFAVELK